MAGVVWAGDRVVVGDYTPRHSTNLGESFVASAVPAYMTPAGAWPNARQVGYAPVGGGRIMLLSAPGDGTWAVAIRCAELSTDRRQARLIAGGGIVAESDPLAELAETQAKLQAMLSAIIRT